jgi:WD40 repeat protein
MLSWTDTTDSNVAVVSWTKAIDVLSSVKNAKYTVTEWKCDQPDLIALTPETTKTLSLEENEMYVSQNAREENMDAVGARLRIYFKYWGSILALWAIWAGYYIWKKRQTK